MRNKISIYSLALLGMLILFNSCKKEYETIQSIDDAKIQAYIKSNNLTVTKDPSGFYYQVITPGTGGLLLDKDSVLYNLDIKSLGGTPYYSTPAYNYEGTYLGYLDPTYRTALIGLRRGAKVKIILPSYLAYGKNGTDVVPSNEIIVSDVTVLPQAKQWEFDDKLISDFLVAKNIVATKSPSRVYYKVNQAGTGETVDISSTITVKYTGRFLNGSIFDQTIGDATVEYPLSSVVKGWEVLLGMQKGAKTRIFIPSDLAYGLPGSRNSLGVFVVPPHTVLDFDIEIVDVKN